MSFLHRLTQTHAPEFPDGLTWLNSRPLTMRQLAGRPVLIDFWTYSCVNCLRTLPHLRRWHETYSALGLTIIGVHTPEFAFEKEESNVESSVRSLDIPYPIVLDGDYAVWNLYANRWWPRHFLVNKDGVVVHDHVGEGGYAETEHAIQKALMEIGATDLPAIPEDAAQGGDVCYKTTPEIYLGYLRATYTNAGDFLPDAEEAFTDNAQEHIDDKPTLHGHWRIADEYVEHTKALPMPTEYLAIKYSAFGVNIVMSTTGKKAVIEVELDGQPLSKDMVGRDVEWKAGKAVIAVKESRMYEIIRSGVYHRATLKLKVADEGLRMYALTFNGCS